MNNVLVAYFSKTGTTEKVAQNIAAAVGGTLFEIKTEKVYPKSYLKTVAAAKIEQLKGELPVLTEKIPNMEEYDTVFLGFPLWWFTCPNAIFSFLATYDFSGKTIRPFCTHGGSGPRHTAEDIRKACSAAVVTETFDATKASEEALKNFCEDR